MKRVLVYRHAKTEKAGDNMADFVREITDVGERQARSIGKLLAGEELLPELILSSDAVRAVQTAELTAEEAGYDGEIREQEELYGADAKDYITVLRQQDDTYSTLMIVGHNPAIEDLLESLLGRHEKMKTGWIAELELSVDSWEQLGASGEITIKRTLKPET